MYFSEIYQSWKETQEQKYRQLLRALGREFFESAGAALDLGCAGGFFEDFLEQEGIEASITGVDTDFFDNYFPFVLGDGNELPFKQNSFDTIFCIDSMHLITKNDFARVLRSGGVILATIFFNEWNYDEKKAAMKEKLHGFEILLEFELDGTEKEYVVVARKK